MKKIVIIKELKQKKNQKKSINKDQISMINQYFTNSLDKLETQSIEQELRKKLCGYKQQDKLKKKYDSETFLNLDELVDKMVASKLVCFYCKIRVNIFYNFARDPQQWTLDRKDNSIGHSCENTIICCLKCNLQRRTQNMDKFLFTKNLQIIKTG
jgi:hypothetical protein